MILGDTLELARSYAEQLKAPFPILSDPEREIYHRYALTKDFIGIQHTASIIVDQNGMIHYIKRALNPTKWLVESRELLRAVQF